MSDDEFRSSSLAAAAGGRPLIIEEPPLQNGRKQYLSPEQHHHDHRWKAPFKSRSCWSELCCDSRQNSINHESLFAMKPLVNDREKARSMILADSNGNDVDTRTTTTTGNASAAPCAACHQHVARKTVSSSVKESSKRRFELSPEDETTADSSSATALCRTQYERTDVELGATQPLLPSSLGSASPSTVPSAKMNNLPEQRRQRSSSKGERDDEEGGGRNRDGKRESRISVGDGPKNNKKFRRNQVKRGRMVKVCPLKLVGFFPKNVLEKIIPTEKIGQEMELRLTWPTGTTAVTAKTSQRSSDIVFRITNARKQEEDRCSNDDIKITSNATDKPLNPGTAGYRYRQRRVAESNVMDCALQLFNSRNCNDFLYFTIQRQLGASSGNRYNMSLHEFPRGSIETQNSSASEPRHEVPPSARHLLKQSDASSSSSWQEYSETAEKKLRILCSDCRANINPIRLQTECLGCNKRFGGFRRRRHHRRDKSFFDEDELETQVLATKTKAMVDLRRVLIEFNVHLQARTIFFFNRIVSRVTEVNHFVNLFNIDVVQSGSIRFLWRVQDAQIVVRFLCRNSGKCHSKLYQMRFKLGAPSSGAKSFSLVAFNIAKFEDYLGESGILLLPELLVSRRICSSMCY